VTGDQSRTDRLEAARGRSYTPGDEQSDHAHGEPADHGHERTRQRNRTKTRSRVAWNSQTYMRPTGADTSVRIKYPITWVEANSENVGTSKVWVLPTSETNTT
jgi:hypothetical protein